MTVGEKAAWVFSRLATSRRYPRLRPRNTDRRRCGNSVKGAVAI
ncbi:hypothetical protein NSERUTF1_5185 [Nocardia seriolae]|nr:hypothetical protein NSERUTF1_5185 [Nocardia seriolae]